MASEKNNDIRKAHILLGSYWLYNVIRTGNLPGSTVDVLKIQGNSLKKELREKRSAKKTGGADPGRSAGRSKAGLSAVKAGAGLLPRKADTGNSKKKMPGKILKFIFKKQRLF